MAQWKMNGYDIMAMRPSSRHDGAHVVLGMRLDSNRQVFEYVTAIVSTDSLYEATEWVWGHYFESQNDNSETDFYDR